jgi:ABC-type multidrug transport system ATPase subunit
LTFFHYQAVDDSLKSVNLFHGGVGDKQVGMYSGGMKRRLSVAISLIGDPKVFFLFLCLKFYPYPTNSITSWL